MQVQILPCHQISDFLYTINRYLSSPIPQVSTSVLVSNILIGLLFFFDTNFKLNMSSRTHYGNHSSAGNAFKLRYGNISPVVDKYICISDAMDCITCTKNKKNSRVLKSAMCLAICGQRH